MSFDPEPVLSTLKPFQRATVEYVIGRFQAGAQRFLVADEVGLGKNAGRAGSDLGAAVSNCPMASGPILSMFCSNAAIARQKPADPECLARW